MFGRIGTGELILILIIALIVVGPSKLPELGRTLGKSINEFKKFSNDIKDDLSVEDKPKKESQKVEQEVENSVNNVKIDDNSQSNDIQ